MLNRVVAKRLDPAATPLAAVMTPNPDTISLDATLLEALHMMHDNKYLHLPVVDGDAVVGVVDVMEVVYATMGDGDDEGWSTLMTLDDDASSDAASKQGSSSRAGSLRKPKKAEKPRPAEGRGVACNSAYLRAFSSAAINAAFSSGRPMVIRSHCGRL